jgi:predicted ATP-grasp superfamily ATP-dependent carboligase
VRSPARRAVVFPAAHPRAVAVIRSLGRAGIPVAVADPHAKCQGFHSRFAAEKYQIAAGDDGARAFLDWLGPRGGGVLFPTSDEMLALCAREADRLEKHFTLAIPPWSVLERIYDRARCHALASAAGLRTPAHWVPRDAAELEGVLPQLDFERRHYVLKTDVIDAPADAATGRRTRVAGRSRELLRERWLEIAARSERPPLIEEVVAGESDRCIGVTGVVDRSHELVFAYCVRRLKLHTYTRGGDFAHPYELGANVFCETTRDPEALEAARRLVRALGHVGAVTVEFRRDSIDDRLVLIKVDPRPVRATSLSRAVGLDVPLATWRVFNDEPPGGWPAEVRDGVGWLWLTAWVQALRQPREPGVAGRELRALLGRLPRLRAFAYLDGGDPLPALRDASEWLPVSLRRRFRSALHRRHQRRTPVERVPAG